MAAATRSASKRAGAHPAGRGEIDHQHTHRPVALGLQNETALELQGGAQHDGEHDGFAKKLGDRQRVVVAAEDGIDRRSEPYDAAAQIERADLERQDRIIDAGLRRRPNRDGQIGIVHRKQYRRRGGNCEPSCRSPGLS